MHISTIKKIKAQNEKRKLKTSQEKTLNDERIENTHNRIESNKEYFNYLFKIMESYVGTAKTFAALSTAIFSFYFFKIDEIKIAFNTNPDLEKILMFAWGSLGISILTSAIYQYLATLLVEDEAEFEGENYSRYINYLSFSYFVMVSTMMAGLIFSLKFIYQLYF